MKVVRYAAAAGLTAFVIYLLVVGQSILLPFVIAVFAWYLINALATLSGRLSIAGRALSGPLRFTLAVVMVCGMTWLVIAIVNHNVGQIIAAGPNYQQELLRLANRGSSWLGGEEVNDLRDLLGGVDLGNIIRNLTRGLTGMLGGIVMVAVYTVFLLVEQKHFDRKMSALFPDPQRQVLVRRILERIGTETQTYIWLKTVVSAATAVGSYAVLRAVRLDLAAFFAVLAFGLNFIPYIGSTLSVILPALQALVQFDTPTPVLVTTIGLAIVQFSGGYILEPRLMGTGLNVSPVFVLMSLAFWGSIWGVVGMFLAVPMMVVVMIVCSNFEATRPIAVLMSPDGRLRK